MNYSITRGNGGVIAWTNEQVAYIIQKYTQENYTLKQLGREFGCSYGSIRNLLNQHGISSRGNKQGYPRDSFYFNQIDTPAKAYWLGLLYADGCVSSDSSKHELELGLKDEEHVKKFKEALGAYNHKITTVTDKRWSQICYIYHFSIKDKQLYNDLIKWGCTPNKSLTLGKIPNIPRDYISHFIRGYFDGDGSLHWVNSTNNYRIAFCGTKAFLKDLTKELVLPNTSPQARESKDYQIQIMGRHQVYRVLEYMYKDSTPEIRLNRKYDLYLKATEWAQGH